MAAIGAGPVSRAKFLGETRVGSELAPVPDADSQPPEQAFAAHADTPVLGCVCYDGEDFFLMKIISGIMAGLFLFSVAVQYNDPDPLR